MPIQNLVRDDHIQLIMTLLIACTDCVEFFRYTFMEEIQGNLFAVISILLVFSTSILQFSVTFTAVREKAKGTSELTKFQKFLDQFFGTELWSIALTMITQDIPYLISRIVLVAAFGIISDMTIFLFIIKNCMLVYFDIYRIFYIIKESKQATF